MVYFQTKIFIIHKIWDVSQAQQPGKTAFSTDIRSLMNNFIKDFISLKTDHMQQEAYGTAQSSLLAKTNGHTGMSTSLRLGSLRKLTQPQSTGKSPLKFGVMDVKGEFTCPRVLLNRNLQVGGRRVSF